MSRANSPKLEGFSANGHILSGIVPKDLEVKSAFSWNPRGSNAKRFTISLFLLSV
jgi:hypothetical protein